MVPLTNCHNSFEEIFHSFFRQNEVTEIRALGLTGKGPWEGWAKGTVSGYFDDPVKFAKAAESLDKLKKATGIYFVLNPVNSALLARGNNRLVVPKNTTTDEQVVCHRWLLTDTDPIRPSGISATDQETLLATNRINKIVAFLQESSFPGPIKCNSGNGSHAIYRLPNLPNSQEITDLKKLALQALHHKFGGNGVDVDQKVFNPARITKLYGTWARKGDSVPDRPHRQSFIEHIPEPIQPVTLEQLKWLASLAPKEETHAPVQPRVQPGNNSLGRMDVQAYLSHYGIEIVKTKQQAGATLYCLKHCVFDPEHVNNEASIVQANDGKLLYQCFHNSCQGKTWHDARQVISGADSLGQFCDGYDPNKWNKNKYESSGVKLTDTVDEPESEEPSQWDNARELFPRLPFPWEVLPEEIAESLKQLARSQATSPLSLPGAAVSIFASVLGSTVSVSPKKSWREPFIFWFADIRPSGSGKTPAARALCSVLYKAQTQADEDYKQRLEEELAKKTKDRRPVPRARSYFITDLTLEGLRADTTGHGGSACVLDELSSFISGQNQYKSKGSDRESWIALHDGNPARIVRAKESYTISGARICLVGGIQPIVWQVSFGSEKGLFLTDGTVYRFLATYEGDQIYKLTKESWSDENREAWERTLTLAMEWSDELIAGKDWKPKKICLSDDAQELFFDWCNRLQETKPELPDQLKGYIPKLVGYSLRLSGVLYCMNHFATGSFPGLILEREDMQRGIDAATFYAGHIVDAAQSLSSSDVPFEVTEQVRRLAETLESLKPKLDSGRLAVGFIQEKFNELAGSEQQMKYPHAMGALIRKCGLTIPEGHFRANKRAKVKCLSWDKKTDSFLKQVPKVPVVHNSVNHAGLDAGTLKNQSPRLRALEQQAMWTMGTLGTLFLRKMKKTTYRTMWKLQRMLS